MYNEHFIADFCSFLANTFSNLYMNVYHKMKNRKKYIVGTIPKPNIKIVERGQIDTPNTQIYDRLLSLLGISTSNTTGGVRLVLLAQ